MGPLEINQAFLLGTRPVFKAFGDGIHILSAGECEGDPDDVTFQLTECEVVTPHDGEGSQHRNTSLGTERGGRV